MLNAAPLIKLGDMLRGLATASSAVMNQGAVDFMAQFGVQVICMIHTAYGDGPCDS